MKKTYKALAWGPEAVDFQERVNFDRMRKDRAARVRAKMKDHGVPVVIVTGENMRYATGIKNPVHLPQGRQYGILFADSEDPIVFLQYEAVIHNRASTRWIRPENIRNIPAVLGEAGAAAEEFVAKKQADIIFEALKERGVQKEKIGLEYFPPALKSRLEVAGIRFVAAKEVLIEARKIKTEDEINCLRMCGAIVDKAWAKIFENAKPGVSNCELAALAMEVLIRNGAETPVVSLRSGPLCAPNYMGVVTDRIMQMGDLGFADIYGVMYGGYRSCYYRTWKVGRRPTAKELDWYKMAYEWMCAGQEALKPGVTTADVARRLPDFKVYGLRSEEEVDGNAECHGVGMGQAEFPSIRRLYSIDNPVVIEEGMVFAVETWMGEDFVGGCRVENVGVIRKEGFENLYTWPDDEMMVPYVMY